AGGSLGAGRVLAVEVVLADVDHRQRPERGHVHRLVQEALAERAVAEEARRDLAAAPHLRRQRGPGRDPGGATHDGVGAEVAPLGHRIFTASPRLPWPGPAADAPAIAAILHRRPRACQGPPVTAGRDAA